MSGPRERPTTRQLEAAVAVADRLSFRRAAEALFVTQPALSVQVKNLERLLGLQLFERDRKGVLVTPAGARVLERARAVLAELDALGELARALEPPLSGRLRLGVIPTVAPYVLPRALAAVRKRYPALELFLREERTPRLVELVRRGELDLALLALEADLGGLATRPLYRDPFLLAVPTGHPLAARAAVRERELAAEQVLLLEDGHCLRDQALAVCELAGAREVGDFRASSLGTLVQMVASGLGLTLLPALAAGVEAKARSGIAVVPLEAGATAPQPGRTIGFAWRPTSARGAEFELLARLFAEQAPVGAEGPP